MATTLKTKNSVTAASAPSSLAQGELAVNITDKKLWVGNAATTPVQLIGTGADASFTNLAYTGTLTGGTGVVNIGSGQIYKDASGYVGINQTTPAGPLDVVGRTYWGSTTRSGITPSTTGGMYIYQNNNGGSFEIAAKVGGTSNTLGGSTRLFFDPAGLFQIQTQDSLALTIDNSQKVGIGTSSPVGKLDIISGTARMYFSNQSATAFLTAINTTNSAYAPMAINGSEMILKTGDSERMRIDASGNVCIGTTSSSFKLAVVDGSTATRVYIQNSANAAGGAGIYMQVFNGASVVTDNTIRSDNAGNMGFFTGTTSGSEKMRLTAAGSLQFQVSGQGVSFSNSSAVTNSTLNDYEQGSFTPQILFGGGNTGQTFTNGPNGRYVKVGKYVFIMVGFYFSSKGSSTGTMTLGNLPFTADNFGFYGSYNPVQMTAMTSVPNNIAIIGMNGGLNYATFFQGDCGTALANTNIADYSYGIIAFSYTANF